MNFYKLLFITFCIAFLLQEANGQSSKPPLHEGFLGRSVLEVQGIMNGAEGYTLFKDGNTSDGRHVIVYESKRASAMMGFYFTKGRCRQFLITFPKRSSEQLLNVLRQDGFEYKDEYNVWINKNDKSAALVNIDDSIISITYDQYIEQEETP